MIVVDAISECFNAMIAFFMKVFSWIKEMIMWLLAGMIAVFLIIVIYVPLRIYTDYSNDEFRKKVKRGDKCFYEVGDDQLCVQVDFISYDRKVVSISYSAKTYSWSEMVPIGKIFIL